MPSTTPDGRALKAPQDFHDAYVANEKEQRWGLSARGLYRWAKQHHYGRHIGTRAALEALFDPGMSVGRGRRQCMPEPEPPTRLVTDGTLSGDGTAENPLTVVPMVGVDGGTF